MRITSVEAVPIRTPAAPPDYQHTWWVTTRTSNVTGARLRPDAE